MIRHCPLTRIPWKGSSTDTLSCQTEICPTRVQSRLQTYMQIAGLGYQKHSCFSRVGAAIARRRKGQDTTAQHGGAGRSKMESKDAWHQYRKAARGCSRERRQRPRTMMSRQPDCTLTFVLARPSTMALRGRRVRVQNKRDLDDHTSRTS